ncbi:PASTA domain-containing protein [Nocardioides nitrophenolicus]|uniref:PASTA domain-containing protein n=1 Tax=Nocardioides nitrophenolicus TaxID=60489 RepID=UPI0019592E80|nr:PASTA domain-containing protein [Nocardioides nitrophenolicus]MBM7519885.1 hypothetical protein [Nocardioides nitrophenolicus]
MSPAGWYPDQARPGLLRYWDGQRWTHHTRSAYPAPGALARQASKLPVWQSWWVILPGLLFCFPLGLVGLWLRPGLGTSVRWLLTACTAGFLVLVLALPDAPEATRDATTTAADETPAGRASTAPSPEPSTTGTVDEPSTAAPTPVHVPDLTGLSRQDAQTALEQLGLVLGEVTGKPSRRTADTVLRQAVPTGAEALPGAIVDVVLAMPLPVVPDVRGIPQARAAKRLRQAGFVVEVSTRETRTGADGVVLSQTPGAEARKRPGATIRIVVSDVRIAPLAETNCTAGYSPCLAPASDYDCAGGSGDGPKYVYGTVKVTGSDPYDLDRDGNGLGCD